MEEQLDQSAPADQREPQRLSRWLLSGGAGETGALPGEPASPGDPFDVLIINVCSLAWHDVEASGLSGHPVWSPLRHSLQPLQLRHLLQRPSSIRLLRASCGQTSHQGLYVTAPKQCLLFENLAQLGFAKQVAMDHSGILAIT